MVRAAEEVGANIKGFPTCTAGSFRLLFFGEDRVIAAGFSLRLFAQLKTCGYHNLLRKLKLVATFMKSKLLPNFLQLRGEVTQDESIRGHTGL